MATPNTATPAASNTFAWREPTKEELPQPEVPQEMDPGPGGGKAGSALDWDDEASSKKPVPQKKS